MLADRLTGGTARYFGSQLICRLKVVGEEVTSIGAVHDSTIRSNYKELVHVCKKTGGENKCYLGYLAHDLIDHPGENFYGTERLGDRDYDTAVYPDIAVSEACSGCHNMHKDTPKTDFKLGTSWVETLFGFHFSIP